MSIAQRSANIFPLAAGPHPRRILSADASPRIKTGSSARHGRRRCSSSILPMSFRPFLPFLPLCSALGSAKVRIKSPPAAPPLAAARRHGHELLAVHHVDRRRREDARPGVELPQQLAGLGVDTRRSSRRYCCRCPTNTRSPAVTTEPAWPKPSNDLLPHQLAGRRDRRRRSSPSGRGPNWSAVDRVHVEQPGPRAVGDRTVVRAAAGPGRDDLVRAGRREHRHQLALSRACSGGMSTGNTGLTGSIGLPAGRVRNRLRRPGLLARASRSRSAPAFP